MSQPELDQLTNQLDAFNAEPALPDPGNVPTDTGVGVPAVPEDSNEDAEPLEEPKSLLEELAEDEPICEGGPTRAAVEKIKAGLTPGTQLMFTPLVNNRGILWKTVNRGEWKRITAMLQKEQDTQKREDFIFAKICLFPDVRDMRVIDTLPAGAVSNVMSEFYLHSGFTPIMESFVL